MFHSLTVSLASHGAFSMLLKTSRSCSNDARRFSDAAAVTFRSSCSNSRMRRSLASHVSGGTVHSASAKQKDGLWRATFRSSCSNDHHNRWLGSCSASAKQKDGSRMRRQLFGFSETERRFSDETVYCLCVFCLAKQKDGSRMVYCLCVFVA